MSRESFPVFGVDGAVMTGTAVNTSLVTRPTGDCDITYQVVITETTPSLTGTLIVQVSNSARTVADADAAFETYDLVTIPAIAGAMTFGLQLERMKWGRVRLKYTNATGVGLIKADVVRG